MTIEIPVSWGDFFDRITILEIKSQRLQDPIQVENVKKELRLLTELTKRHFAGPEDLDALIEQLRTVNKKLWDIENAIRKCELAKDFGDEFIALARSVYMTNDKRADLKYQINQLLDSDLVEEKAYQAYK